MREKVVGGGLLEKRWSNLPVTGVAIARFGVGIYLVDSDIFVQQQESSRRGGLKVSSSKVRNSRRIEALVTCPGQEQGLVCRNTKARIIGGGGGPVEKGESRGRGEPRVALLELNAWKSSSKSCRLFRHRT